MPGSAPREGDDSIVAMISDCRVDREVMRRRWVIYLGGGGGELSFALFVLSVEWKEIGALRYDSFIKIVQFDFSSV